MPPKSRAKKEKKKRRGGSPGPRGRRSKHAPGSAIGAAADVIARQGREGNRAIVEEPPLPEWVTRTWYDHYIQPVARDMRDVRRQAEDEQAWFGKKIIAFARATGGKPVTKVGLTDREQAAIEAHHARLVNRAIRRKEKPPTFKKKMHTRQASVPIFAEPLQTADIKRLTTATEKGRHLEATRFKGTGLGHRAVRDVLRGGIVYDTLDEIREAMQLFADSTEIIVRCKVTLFAKNRTNAGYGDVKLAIMAPNGHIAELQLLFKPLFDLKEKMHGPYEVLRSFQRKGSLRAFFLEHIDDTDPEVQRALGAMMRALHHSQDLARPVLRTVDATKRSEKERFYALEKTMNAKARSMLKERGPLVSGT